MAYTIWFFGIPIIGVWLYREMAFAMSVARIARPPKVSLLSVFAGYGALALFAVSEYFGMWSGMHSVAVIGLVLGLVPLLLAQGFLLRRTWPISAYHRATIALSFAFPGALALFVAFAFAIEK